MEGHVSGLGRRQGNGYESSSLWWTLMYMCLCLYLCVCVCIIPVVLGSLSWLWVQGSLLLGFLRGAGDCTRVGCMQSKHRALV